MFGAILKGGAWCATGALTTIGALTFVPDDAWKSFPDALAPVRTALAQIGVAPPQYSPNADDAGGETARSGEKSGDLSGLGGLDGSNSGETALSARTSVRIGRRNGPLGGRFLAENGAGLDVDSVARSGAALEKPELSANSNGGGAKTISDSDAFSGFNDVESAINAENAPVATIERNAESAQNIETAQNTALAEENDGAFPDDSAFVPSENGDDWANWDDDVDFAQGDAGVGAPLDSVLAPSDKTAGVATGKTEEYPDSDAIPAFDLENLTETPKNSAVADVSGAASEANLQENPLKSANSIVEASVPSAKETRFITESSSQDSGDWATELENALKVAESLETARQNGGDAANTANWGEFAQQTKDVFLTLNRIRRERGAELAPETTARLNGALDRLAFDVFYNPRTAILEPLYIVGEGETLASVAAKFSATPETLGAINGLDVASDAPLPVGSALKTVRGPVAAELSASKKELLLTFNGLYAGRFAFGLPEKAATLRGKFVVSGKIVNPSCDAIDAAGNPTTIPGGSPENPLGAAWIALVGEDGGAGPGLQGTNRPELVGTLVRENGGIIFSDREISQLNVLLPIGAEVVFVD